MLICQELETLTYNTQLENIDPLVNIFKLISKIVWNLFALSPTLASCAQRQTPTLEYIKVL